MHINLKVADRCAKLIAIFERKSTPANERLNAASMFGQILSDNQITFFELAIRSNSANANSAAAQEALCREIAELRTAIVHEKDTITKLQAEAVATASENATLRQRIADLEHTCEQSQTAPNPSGRNVERPDNHDTAESADDGRVCDLSAADFAALAQSKFRRCSYKSALAYALRIPIKLLNAYILTDCIPRRFAERVAALTDEDILPASRKHWNIFERARLRDLLRKKSYSDVELAHMLTAEFGRRIYESGVARQRRRTRMVSAPAARPSVYASAMDRAVP